FVFAALPPGSHTIEIVTGAGWVVVSGSVTTTLALHSRDDVELPPLVLVRPGVVEGSVFADRDSDGVRDAAAPGIGGVRAHPGDRGAPTEADGHSIFTGVMPGHYLVDLEDAGRRTAGEDPYELTLPSNGHVVVPPVGFAGAAGVRGRVFDDRD